MDSREQKDPVPFTWENSLITAIHCNIPIADYLEMTPYELLLHAEVHQEKMLAQAQQEVTLVWLGEYYHRTKKLPSLKKVLDEFFGQSKKQMSDDEMLAMVKKLHLQFGGEIENEEGEHHSSS